MNADAQSSPAKPDEPTGSLEKSLESAKPGSQGEASGNPAPLPDAVSVSRSATGPQSSQEKASAKATSTFRDAVVTAIAGHCVNFIVLILVVGFLSIFGNWQGVATFFKKLSEVNLDPGNIAGQLFSQGQRAKAFMVPLEDGSYSVTGLPIEVNIKLDASGGSSQGAEFGKKRFKKLEILYKGMPDKVLLFSQGGDFVAHGKSIEPQVDAEANCSVGAEWFVPNPVISDAQAQTMIVIVLSISNLDPQAPTCPV